MADVTVRGAGILGLSVAWACVKKGARVKIIDPNGAASGSSGGIVGALAPHVPENWNSKKAFQLESLLMAETFWREIEATGGTTSGYARAGRIQPVMDDAALCLALRRCETARELWQGKADWTVERYTSDIWAPLTPTGWVIRDTLSAHLHPRKACLALVSALASKGVQIDPDGAEQGQVLWATGFDGLKRLSAEHSRAVGNGVKGQAALLQFDARFSPQIFAESVHIVPHLDGTVAIGSTSEREYLEEATTDQQLDNVVAKACAAVPALQDATVVQRWAGVRPRARSRAPMLGHWPGKPGHFIANGGFKIGFGMAPKIAQVMANLMLDNRNEIPKGFEVSASF
ncbi:NAD(P)/FAD-dependent oxidoreductase [Roseobacter sp. EG26]|uniref:NAD(P)/FAD-dependent oxidoreductase n=1 Tax=Roseobacter sp. EG26 TaxID=3412477 RepID=UPI003CE4A6AE